MSGLTDLTKEQLEAHLEHLKTKHAEMSATYKRAVDINEAEDYTLRVKGDVDSLAAMITECELAIANA
jgi:hypothetical protein